jgi:hypothetical protein
MKHRKLRIAWSVAWCELAVLLIALAGCSHQPAPLNLVSFHGQTREQVSSTLGTPSRDEKFEMSQATGEFRIGLQNTYPLSNPANAHLQIIEMTWDDGNSWITVWFHEINGAWVVLDSCRWDKGEVF